MSSDDDDGDFAYFGTSIEQPDEDNIVARKAPRLEDQVVTDKQGRRRFHGAFTGGFSAGHFNTVGSVEGFTPSTFTSSRAERNKAQAQDVAMFMDEEDMSAHGIAAQKLQATSDFSSGDPGAGKRKRQLPSTGPIPGTPVLLDLVSDMSYSIGVRLLRSLGWREGQGVGPRLSHRDKKKMKKRMQKQKRKHTNAGHSDSSNEEYNSTLPPEYSQATFAPEDYSSDLLSMLLHRRTNTFGLGYQPLSRDNILGSKRDDWMQQQGFSVAADIAAGGASSRGGRGGGNKKKTMTIRGQAFGVGAFEEEDEDIYGVEDMTRYDFTLGGTKGAPGAKTGDPASRGKEGNGVAFGSVTAGGMLELCEVLEGFVLSSSPVVSKAPPPLPTLPPGYIPCHRPLRKRFSSRAFEQSGLGRHDLTHTDRQRILEGGLTASVEVRVGVKGMKPPTPPPHPPQPPTSHETQTTSEGEGLAASEEIPLSALLGEEMDESNTEHRPTMEYKPFVKVPEKQKRYELYLRMKEKGLKGRYGETQPSSMTEWEKAREVQEFDRAAALYKPLNAAMATRFVTSAVLDGTPLLKDGLNMNIKSITSSLVKSSTSESSSAAFSTTSSEPSAPPSSTDPRVNAARTGMFGKLTQLVQDWHPDRLLCKRFNVPQPYPDSRHIGVVSNDGKGSRQKDSGGSSNIFSFLSSTPTLTGPISRQCRTGSGDRGKEESARNDKKKGSRWESDASNEQSSKKQGDERPSRRKVDGENVKELSEDENETPENYGLKVSVDGPPTMDLFKAIFDDSSSDSDDSNLSDSDEEDLRRKIDGKRPPKDSVATSISGVGDENSVKDSSGLDNKARKNRFEARNNGNGDSINEKEKEDGNPISSDRREKSTRLDSDVDITGRSPPRHVFVSKKTKSATTDGHDVSNAVNGSIGDPANVSIVKEVKGKKRSHIARSAVSKSSLSFVIESDNEEDSNFEKVRNEKVNLSLSSGDPEKKGCFLRPDSSRALESGPRKTESTVGKQMNESNNEPELSINDISKTGLKETSFSRKPSQNVQSSLRGSELQPPQKLMESSASGIFANIDFVELNRYRVLMNQDAEESKSSDKVETSSSLSRKDLEPDVQRKSKDYFNRTCTSFSRSADKSRKESSSDDSDSSVDSEDAYGAALPPDFVNPLQVIKNTSGDLSKKITTENTHVRKTSFKEKTSESMKKKRKKKEKKNKKESKHRSKSSHRKDKKKKTKKEKKKKDKRRVSDSDLSESSSD